MIFFRWVRVQTVKTLREFHHLKSSFIYSLSMIHCSEQEKEERRRILTYNNVDECLLVGLGKFHALQLLTCGLCLMATIVETLNIGFVIPLIEMECEMILTLSQKGILNSAAFVGESQNEFRHSIRNFLRKLNFQELSPLRFSGDS